MGDRSLPHFDNPPVVETVLGVQFVPIHELTNAHLGAFWATLDEDWTAVQDAPTLDPVVERFGLEPAWGNLASLRLTQDPSSRLQIQNQQKDRMIQVQNGRMHYNWLGQKGGPYPRYAQVRPEFDDAWKRFQQFLESRSFPKPKANQWEVTYVNQMPKGTVWDKPEDWAGVLPGLVASGFGPKDVCLEGFGGQWRFEIQKRRGRLHVKVQQGKRTIPDECEILRVDLTARGSISDDPEMGLSLRDGLDLGHETIVRAFVELTSDQARKHWRQR